MNDAYRLPQHVKPGCTHQLGCKCTPPYWLRLSSSIEQQREARIRAPFILLEETK